ncbi:MAG: hypothetical protein ACLTG4_03200 [Oscillospiraceae bacterium]
MRRKHVAAIETSAEDPREFIADIKSAGMQSTQCPNYKVSMSMERKGLDASSSPATRSAAIRRLTAWAHSSSRAAAADMKIGHRRRRHRGRPRPRSCARARRFRRCHGHPLRVRR